MPKLSNNAHDINFTLDDIGGRLESLATDAQDLQDYPELSRISPLVVELLRSIRNLQSDAKILKKRAQVEFIR